MWFIFGLRLSGHKEVTLYSWVINVTVIGSWKSRNVFVLLKLKNWCSVGYSSSPFISLRRSQRMVKLCNNYNHSTLCLWGKWTLFIFNIPCTLKQARKLEVPSKGSHSYSCCSTLRKNLHEERNLNVLQS